MKESENIYEDSIATYSLYFIKIHLDIPYSDTSPKLDSEIQLSKVFISFVVSSEIIVNYQALR